MSDFEFPGVNLALTTPFDENGRVDLARLVQLIERYLDAGIRGFLLSSGTGMHVYLSRDESRALVEQGARVIDGRARIMVQVSALLLDDVIERSRHAAGHGAAAVMVLPPFFEGPTDDQGVFDFYAAVAAANVPIIGYNVPQAVGVEVTPALLHRLADIPQFLSLKDSSGDLGKQADLIRTGVPVINGADPLALYALLAGARGLIWGGANIAPRTCVALLRAVHAGKWDDAREIWRLLEPIMSLIWAGDYVQSVYAAAELTGYGAGHPRRPFSKLAPHRVDAIRAALGDLISRERI